MPSRIQQGTEKYPAEHLVTEALSAIFSDSPGPHLIGVGGAGGTGKSSFCHYLQERLPDCAVLPANHYRYSREERKTSGLLGSHPKANNVSLLIKHLQDLLEGREIEHPVYDPVTGLTDSTCCFHPRKYILLDGEIACLEDVRNSLDLLIFIDSDWRFQLDNRLRRDTIQYKQSLEKALTTFVQSNLRDFSEFIAPAKEAADVTVRSTHDFYFHVESVSEKLASPIRMAKEKFASRVDLNGLVIPALTPFDEDNRLAEREYLRLLEWFAESGVKRLLVNGTTGEFFSLSPQERRRAFLLARRHFPGTLIYQAGRNSLVETIEEARWGEDHGADAIMSLGPFYFANAPESGLVDYLNAVADSVRLPFMIYNFPRHTQNALTGEMLSSIRHYGVKDSSADLSLIPSSPHYFVGGDPKILDAYGRGACGFISASANTSPVLYALMEKALCEGDSARSRTLQEEITSVASTFSGPLAISKIKHAVSLRLPGFPRRVRPPMATLNAEQAAVVEDFLANGGGNEPS